MFVLSKNAICVCPHQGRLSFSPEGGATSGKNELLTVAEFKKASISGCINPPNAGGPCTSVSMAQDLCGQGMKIKGQPVATEGIIALTEKGMPITVNDPGNTKVKVQPGVSAMSKANFQKEIQKKAAQNASASSQNENKNNGKFKQILKMKWEQPSIHLEETVKLSAETRGFVKGTPVHIGIYQFHESSDQHQLIESLKAEVKEFKETVESPDSKKSGQVTRKYNGIVAVATMPYFVGEKGWIT